jgi:hypothetical protein
VERSTLYDAVLACLPSLPGLGLVRDERASLPHFLSTLVLPSLMAKSKFLF